MAPNKTYQVSFSNDKQVTLKSEEISLKDLILYEEGNTMVLQSENKIFNIVITHFDPIEKTYEININNKKLTLKLHDHLDQLISEMGLDVDTDDAVSNVEAPMPGLVLDILVTEGQEVEKGTPLLVLEAMKMENIIKANGQATIEKIHVAKGDKVEKSQQLINYLG